MNGWGPYVPVAERRARARRAVARRLGKGRTPQPVVIEGRKIARTFWGIAWCEHLLKFSDYANRLPRGATYARNGSVCHLEVDVGRIDAYVAGTSTYCVKIEVEPLSRTRWKALKAACEGSIGSLIELLEGRLSEAVMRTVTDKTDGLFPQPREITMDCTCPDWAGMCKHIAAVMYGVGARLDHSPELLFTLRGVDHDELVTGGADAASAVANAVNATGSGAPRLPQAALSDIFGIVIDETPVATPKRQPARPRWKKKASTKSRTATSKPTGAPAGKGAPARKKAASHAPRWTGEIVRTLRVDNGLDELSLAIELGVSEEKVMRWEASTGALRLGARDRAELEKWRKYIEQG